ncbi:MAG: GMC family oxidoreductase [Acidimicrobiales bacterium]
MSRRAIVIGSGPGGAVAAMALARARWDVVVLEKGPNLFGDLTSPTPSTTFSNDELKRRRNFGEADPEVEPRTFRRDRTSDQPLFTGAVQAMPQTVGGGTVHWDAKTPRFWDIDFRKRSMLGPIDGASVVDWPFDYATIEPYYDEIERLIGVAGDADELPELTRRHAPRSREFPMPNGPDQYSSLRLAKGCTDLGLHPYVVPMAINSEEYDDRPACNECGFCAGYGCPVHARLGALAPLRDALLHGVELRPESLVTRIVHDGRRATGVTWTDARGGSHHESADVVVLAANPIESIRLAMLSEVPDPHDQIGRHLMFHWYSQGTAIFLDERVHPHRGRAYTHCLDDFCDVEFPGARDAAKRAGLPYLRGGVLELGGSQHPMDEALLYQELLALLAPEKPFGTVFKELMRASLLRDRMSGVEMIGEDLPYATNRVDLDPSVRDLRGVPVPRITYDAGPHEIAAQEFYLPKVAAILEASGADVSFAVPQLPSARFPVAASDVPSTRHIMGGLRMGDDPLVSVTDDVGRFHTLDGLYVTDGSLFPTSGAHNPTLTIMATALRNTRAWA